MSPRYRISPQGRPALSDAEINAHKDAKRLFYNYHKAVKPLYKKPLYKDPRTFLALLLIVLIAILVSEADKKKDRPQPVPERSE